MALTTGDTRRWTKRRAAAAARARIVQRPPMRNTPAPGTEAVRQGMQLQGSPHRSTIAPVFQWAPQKWPEQQSWPTPNLSLPGAGRRPPDRGFTQRLHDTAAQEPKVVVHNPSKGDKVIMCTLSAYGLLPGSNAEVALAALPRAATQDLTSRRPPSRHSAQFDSLIRELASKKRVEPPFTVGWALPLHEAGQKASDPRMVEEWKLLVNDFDPVVTFGLHQKKVNGWRAEAQARPRPPMIPVPPLQQLPRSKHEEYLQVGVCHGNDPNRTGRRAWPEREQGRSPAGALLRSRPDSHPACRRGVKTVSSRPTVSVRHCMAC